MPPGYEGTAAAEVDRTRRGFVEDDLDEIPF